MNRTEHLNNLVNKKKRVELSVEDNITPFVCIRQLSAISPHIAVLLNRTINQVDCSNPQFFYDAVLGIFPKIPMRRYYEFPPVVREKKNDNKPSDLEKEIACNMQISVRELREFDSDFLKSVGL